MTSNQAFAKKLQAAIKAKIHELGAEADDDLSEFVMVLSANKKDKTQMKKELHLFLGKNTGCFVDWLFATLERIQKTLVELKKHEKSSKTESSKKDKTTKHESSSSSKSSKTESLKQEKSLKEEDSRKSIRKSTRREKLPEPSRTTKKSKVDEPSRHDRSPRRKDKYSNYESKSSSHRKSPNVERSKKLKKHSKHEKSKKENDTKSQKHIDEVQAVKISDSEEEPSKSVKTLSRKTKKETTPDKPSKRPRVCPPPSNDSIEINKKPSVDNSVSTKPSTIQESSSPKAKETEEVSGRSSESTPAPLSNLWDGRITIDEESSDDDAEAQIDALLDGLDDLIGTIPETSILSGPNLSSHLFQQQSPSPTQSSETPTIVSNSNVEAPMKRFPERCKFWPGCDKKEQCLYHHPTEVCNMFPNCSFGDKCLNIHPLCKFNKKCKKPRCPFTHDLKGVATVVMYPHDVANAIQSSSTSTTSILGKTNSIAQSNMATPCKFGGRCVLNNCKFIHPPPCRFGLRCQNHNCLYSHQKPDLKKFQWVNNHS